MKKLLLFIVLFSLGILSVAQVITPFKIRKTVTQKGGIIYLSNTSSKATPDNIVQNEMPPSGTGYDNNFTNTYVDIDGDASTFMSSSDQLNLPNCSEITWAGLYWGADCSVGDENYATRDQVKLKVNNGSYINLTADYKYDNTTGFKTYHCFKDVTSILKANGLNDRYTIANVATDIGGKNLFGGWSIVVIYKNSTQTMRNLTVFDGLASVTAGTYSTVDIPISGFQTPLAGPVTFELGLIAYDGDRSLTGDQLLFKGASSFINISDALHATNDVFNSTLSRKGVLTPLRNPSYNNTLGYDANIFSPENSSKNYIGNNAISATIRQTTGGETYLTQVVTSAIDVYEPDLRSAVRVKNITHPGTTTAEKGDILEYTVNGLNIGSDPSVNTFVTDTIEGNAQYVPGSLIITYGPNSGAKTDAAGDDQAEYNSTTKTVKVRIGTGANSSKGGLVNNSPVGSDSTQFKFRVQATSDCVFLACDAIIDNSAFITGTGNVSGNTFDNASNPGVFDALGCPIPGTTKTPISLTGCAAPTASANSPICQGGTINFTASDSPSATYLWTGPNNFSSTLREPVITNVTAANAGIYTANIFIKGKPCHFVYSFKADINIANAGPDQTNNLTCGLTTTTLAGNNPAGTTGTWTIVSGTGGSFGAGHTATSTTANSTFNGVAGNAYVLRWSLNSSGCDPTSDDVNIRFNAGPTGSVLSGTSSVCYNSYATLKVAVTGGSAPYTVILNNGGGTFTNYTSGNDLIVGPLTASTTYSLVSVTDANGCASTGLSGSAVITVSNAITGTGIITQLNPPVSGGGPKTAGTASGTGWTTTGNTVASDNSYASVSQNSNGNSNYLYLSNFGFAIPAGSTIVGVEATTERSYTTTGSRTVSNSRISLQSNTSSIGSNQTISYPLNTDATVTTGGPTNMWGATTLTLTPAIVNNSNFGLRYRITAGNGTGTTTARIDYVTLKIYYTPAATYCDDASSIGFSVATYTNATNYSWTSISGGSVVSGQGTSSALMDFNGAGQSGNYNVCVTASNNCQTLAPSCISIPVSDCPNSSLYLMGNVYWDKNAMTDNLVNGTPVNSANGNQLYATLTLTAGTTAIQNSVPVAANGTYKFPVSASTNYTVFLSTTNYLTGQTPVASLPAGCSNTGEIVNNITNTTTGSDGTPDGKLAVSGFTTNNKVNVNFGIKISTPPLAVNDVATTNEDTPVTVNVILNDYDVDGTVAANTVDLDPATPGIQNSLTNAYGSWTVNSSGVVTYNPLLNFSGNANVTYRVNDNDGNTSNTGTLLITVAPVNDPPVAVNDTVTTPEDTPVSINVTSNDYDVDGTVDVSTVDLDPLTSGIQTTYSVSGEGSYSVNPDGVVTFIPDLNYNGVATPVNYTVRDNLGATSASASLTVTVTSVIDPPSAVNDNATTDQNTPVSINVASNDIGVDAPIDATSVDLDVLTAGIQKDLTVPGEGSYHANNLGVVTFTPDPAFFGTTTPVQYIIDDNLGQPSNIGLITVNVIAASAPVAVNDAATTNEGTSVTIDVTANDSAPNGSLNLSRIDLDPATPGIQQSFDVPDKGTFIVDISGIVTLQPTWGFNGIVTGQYTVKDNLGLVSNVATITVTVIHVNQPPVAVDDFISTNEDTPVTFNIVANDYDSDGSIAANSVDLDLSAAGRQTSFTVAGEGTYVVDNAGNVTFTPVLNFNGSATPVPYTVNDDQGLSSDINVPGMISVTVLSVNDPPVAINDAITAPSNSDVTLNISQNDTDVDGTVDPSSIDLDPSFPGIQKTFTVSGEGTYTVDNSGVLTFQPLPSFVGPVTATPVSYKINDNQGATSNSATITITLSDPSAPEALNDLSVINEDASPVLIDILSNDIPGSGNIVPSTIDLDPVAPGAQTDRTTTEGRWQANTTTGAVTFTPAANYFGTAIISYLIFDDNAVPLSSNPATITVVVNPVNDIPSFTKGADQTVCENSDIQIVNGWVSAMSPGPANESSQSLSYIVSNTNNSLFSTQPAIDASGTLFYSLASDQSGLATVSVQIKDNGGTANGGVDQSAIQTFTITVVSQTAPVVGTIIQPTCALTTGSVALSGLPASGTWILTPSSGSIVTNTGTNYTVTGLPASTTYTFTITNSSGCTSIPSAAAVINSIPGSPAIPTASSVLQPSCGETTGSIVFNSQAGVQYSVGSGYQASNTFLNLIPGTYTLSVRSTTDNTCITNGSTTVTINDAPIVPPAPSASASQTFCSGINPKLSDIMVSGSNITWYDAPSGGNVLAAGIALVNGTSYYASQTVLSCESSLRTQVTVTILSCTGPNIVDNTISLNENTPNGTSVYDVNDNNTGNDKDPDGINLVYSITGGNSSGAFTINPSTGVISVADVTKLDFETITSFVLIIHATNGTISDNASITINLLNLNDNNPLSVDDSYSLNEGGTLIVPSAGVLINDTDADGNTITALKVTDPGHGALTLNPDGSFTYIHDGSETISDFFTYRAFDGVNYGNTATVTLTIIPVNDLPVISTVNKSGNEDVTMNFSIADFTSSYTDAESDPLAKIIILSLPANGTLKLSGVNVAVTDEISGVNLVNLTFVPDPNWNGTTNFTWNGSDGTSYALLGASVLITINPVNDLPTIVNISKSINEDNILTFAAADFTGAFTDIDGHLLSKIKITSLPANGTLKLSGVNVNSGDEIATASLSNLTFVPDPDFNGSTSFGWNGFNSVDYALSPANVNITVNPVNDAPVLVNINKSVNEDNVLSFSSADFKGAYSDVDGNPLVKILIGSLPSNGTLKLSGINVNAGDEILTANLSNLSFVPDADWNGSTSFVWNGYDGTEYALSTANVNITVNPVNDPPVLTNLLKSVNEDNTLTFAASDFTTSFSDIDGNSLTKILITSLPANGTLKLSGVNVNVGDEILISAIGSLTFIPNANWNGNTSFGWNGFDGTVHALSGANVNITVNPVNDIPVLTNIAKTTNENTILTFTGIDFTGSFSDVDGNTLVKVLITSLPANGTLKLGTADVNVNDEIPLADLATLTFTPDLNWAGTTSFGWNGFDGTSFAIPDATVDITVNSVNTPPMVGNFAKSVNEDNILNFAASDFTAAFTDIELNILTKIRITSLPANGTLKLSGVNVSVNDEINTSSLPTLTFVPDPNWNGVTTFGWNGFDGTVYALMPATVTITVNPVNDPPTVANISKSGNEDNILTFSASDFTSAFSDIDGNQMTKIKVTSLPLNGSLKLSGTPVSINDEILLADLVNLTYTPAANWNGSTSFGWNGFDGAVYAATAASVNITVNPVNDSPVINSPVLRITINENDGPGQINISANVSDPDGDQLTTSVLSGPEHGIYSVTGSGNIIYTPGTGFSGNDTIVYQVCDNGSPSLCVSGTIFITVTASAPVNHAPVISDITRTTPENESFMFTRSDFLSQYSDAENDTLVKIQITSLPSSGKLTLNGVVITSGQEITWEQLNMIEFLPEPSFTGESSFTWKAYDGKDYSLTAYVRITVTSAEFFIPEGFSPNGDGINDFFIIRGTDNYVVSISIYNRWGNMVYSSKDYKNDWDGISNTGLLLGSKLPDGTYYYVINLNNGEKAKIGYITINR